MATVDKKLRDKEKAQAFIQRIRSADKYHEKWADKFKVKACEKYYEGFQWNAPANYDPYTINLIFSTVEIKLPSLTFDKPISLIRPKPGRQHWDSEKAFAGAIQKEDILNTFLMDSDNSVPEEIRLAVLDSFFRFGIVEVGFSANYIENPNAGKPVLKNDNTPYSSDTGEILEQPKMIPIEEYNYIKRIPAKCFRVGGIDSFKLSRCNWCGYYEYVRTEDLVAAGKDDIINNVESLKWAGARSEEFLEYDEDSEDFKNSGDLTKIWHIWDNRAHSKYIIADSQEELLLDKPFNRLPLFPLVFHNRTHGFYPIPPVFNMLSPQNEQNESREMMRVHRRRFVRKYFVDKNKLDDVQEVDKLENGPDGTHIYVNGNPNEIAAPLQNADLGASASQSMIVSKDDFLIVSGTSAESILGRGGSDTATEATIIQQRTSIRESGGTKIVARWLASIFKEILLQMKENNVLPYWILKTQDWEQADLTTLDDFDFEVDIDVSIISPIETERAKKGYMEFLAILNNYPQMSISPDIVREAANIVGYRNEKIIKQFMEMAQIAMIGMIEQGKQNLAALSQRQVAKSTPDQQEQITNQLTNQVGLQ